MPEHDYVTPFTPASLEIESHQEIHGTPQTESSTYQLAFADNEFLLRDELRPIRLQLELLKPELIMQEQGIDATIAIFGSARTIDSTLAKEQLRLADEALKKRPTDTQLKQEFSLAKKAYSSSRYYDSARELSQLISKWALEKTKKRILVVTGGGPGIMEAGNRGAHDVQAKSIGLNIMIPKEQQPNPYITPELSFLFHYFALRKMHFLIRSKALVAFPGGFGTLDELFNTLTLIQTKKMSPIPVVLFGESYWKQLIDFDFLLDEGMISKEDLDLFHFSDTAQQTLKIIADFHGLES